MAKLRLEKLLFVAALLGCILCLTATAGAQSPGRTSGIEVLWGGSWWPASTLAKKSGLTKIHYTGWGSEWDEWVDAGHIRPPSRTLASARSGQQVEIEWHGSSWPGVVLETRSGFFKVHYTGWGSEWDEWVEIGRLRTTR